MPEAIWIAAHRRLIGDIVRHTSRWSHRLDEPNRSGTDAESERTVEVVVAAVVDRLSDELR